jgi:hypothetical protein
MTSIHRLPPFFRTLSLGLFCLALVSILGGGSSCSWKTGSNHKDNDDTEQASPAGEAGGLISSWKDGHDLILPELGSSDIKLTDFVADLDPRPGHHPIARLREIRGLSVTDFDNLSHVNAEALSRFSRAIITANPDLLGLPPAAGQLRSAGAHVLDSLIMIVHEQVSAQTPFHQQGIATGGEMIFAFDLLGRLVHIENRTVLPQGVVVTVPEELLSAR